MMKNLKKKSTVTGGDSTRGKIVEMLSQALGNHPDDHVESMDVAKEIEEEMYKLYKSVSQDYKAKFRSLSFNLKNPKNPDLRHTVMQGTISAQQLCAMSSQDMASEELKDQRKKAALWHLEATKASQGNQTTTDMFKCSKCGRRETTYYQLQTRSAD